MSVFNVQGFINLTNLFTMKKQILNLGKVLNKAEQRLISGGTDPISGLGSGGNGSGNRKMGVCIVNGSRFSVPCDSVCPDGTAPFCAF